MNRTRPWMDLLLGLLLGLSLGLAIAWWVAPNTRVDLSPAALHNEYKDEFRLLAASAYLATGDTGRAQVRLALLGDTDIVSALIDEALRIQSGQVHTLQYSQDSEQAVNALALLANALQEYDGMPPVVPTSTPVTSGRSPTPTLSAFTLVSTETICDPDQAVSVAKVSLRDRAGNPMPGVEVLITWEGGRQSIFTGLKPEIDPGYADFLLTPGTEYAIQVLPSSLPVPDLSAPVCTREDGSSYSGGLRLVFQQP